MEFDVNLEGLRADISHSLRQKHYTTAVRALVVALDQATIDLEDIDGKTVADKLGLGEYRHRFSQLGAEYGDEEILAKAPERMDKKF